MAVLSLKVLTSQGREQEKEDNFGFEELGIVREENIVADIEFIVIFNPILLCFLLKNFEEASLACSLSKIVISSVRTIQ